ncbi:hypothetical protein CDL12_27683 [Handroanthus impetiginosus]|uniref:Uncharacterized protein n=1 Tax=Handroanthus impetiginosus TaxID=429701 RepID=A0A2G9G3C6_9LAMI|nr:hypothetical protein CDL12_27683 [Handroanthus impetiginosus]
MKDIVYAWTRHIKLRHNLISIVKPPSPNIFHFIGVNPFSLTISSQTAPLTFIISCNVSFCPFSYSLHSTPSCYTNTFHNYEPSTTSIQGKQE